ncbi:biotin transporter BioY [Schaalia sp. Marseille-Q2122]|uniref:biotin transporter BioY n=1 Tax=Schaalia sp. Marseille-Q2122 TaxID=2736604 RepID=UPI00158E9030|nr:biotin transporter BioY [Schaalia sp. Marseille-Q2122]
MSVIAPTSTTSATLASARRVSEARVLADLVGGTRVRDAVIVLAGTALLAIAAQVQIPLPFTPVPVSLATLAVMLIAGTSGLGRAAASTGLYAALGVAGLPIFAAGRAGWAIPSLGYILGYILAAVLIGWVAQRAIGRSLWALLAAGVLASTLVYAAGLAWLVPFTGMSLAEGLSVGVLPFLIGDALKIAVFAGMMLLGYRALDK